jgi:hypothetical protein
MFGLKKDEITGELKRFTKYYFGDEIKKIEMGGAFGKGGETRGTNRNYMGKLERKRPLEGPRCKWKDNNKMNFYEIG